MNTEKLYYTDGHNVAVTATMLKVHNRVYRLAGIIRHNLATIGSPKAPGIAILISGLIIGIIGLAAILPVDLLPGVEVMGRWATVNDYAIALGGVLLIAGLITLFAMKRRYAVHICTATEESDVIVSKERAYIAQIVDGLDKALVERQLEY